MELGVNESVFDVLNILFVLGKMALHQCGVVLGYPFNPEQRIFIVWLLTSLLFALFVFLQSRPGVSNKNTGVPGAFFRFLFPKEVWSHASARLDVRYFFFHQFFRAYLEGAVMTTVSAMVFQQSSALLLSLNDQSPRLAAAWVWGLEWAYILGTVFLSDFVAYGLHRWQHTNPLLWEFHKVHHSAPVMHPFTNYREHPVDNIFYALGHGLTIGLSGGCISYCLGYVPAMPTVYGVVLFSLLFNALGYNLRHSHIWLRWPGKWASVFGCPAHHHIHHSSHPEHINTNFAFMFPVWDVVFGTFCLPDDNSKVKFGLGDGQEAVYTSCLRLYFLPPKKGLFHLKETFFPLR